MYDSRFSGRRSVKNYIVLVVIVIAIIGAVWISGMLPTGNGKIVSPVPDTDTVRIIFVTPTPSSEKDKEASVAGEKDEEEEEEDVGEEE